MDYSKGKWNNNKTSFQLINLLKKDEALQNILAEQFSRSSMPYRHRLYSPQQTFEMFTLQMINTNQSCQNIVLQTIIKQYSENKKYGTLNTSAYCKARKRLPEELMIKVVEASGKYVDEKASSTGWKGLKIKLVDGTTLTMPDTHRNQMEYPQARIQEPGLGFPRLRITGIISLDSGAVLNYEVAPYKGKATGETTLFYRMISSLRENDLIVADRLYSNYFVVAALHQRKIKLIMKSHISRKINFEDGKKLGKKDHIVIWKKPQRPAWMSQEEYELLPGEIKIRQIAKGDEILTTNLLDNKRFSKCEIFKTYRLRWNIELDFRNIKQTLQMDILRCKSPSMIRKEIAAHLFGYNIICLHMIKVSLHKHISRRFLSFKKALYGIRCYQSIIITSKNAAIDDLYQLLLLLGGGSLVGQRPRRREPRVVKRRPKPYKMLNIPRDLARKKLFAA